jgi:hypothetical protein
MRHLALLTLPLIVLALACGGGSDNGPTEKNLRQQLLATWAALQSSDYEKLYSYLSEDVRSHCTLEQLKVQTELVRGSVGPNFLAARLYIDNVVVQGDHATYESTYALNGAILSTGSRGMVWEKDHWVSERDVSAPSNADYPCNPI